MKKHTIIGTAGHIDHGKTSLIKALTGIDTDRLKDEKERGMTIDLGFAHWKDSITIIDVPGHERFIRNMVAGVSMIDFFLFVIAADDGIMPQTIEHLEILKFFNIRNGIFIITKIDLVEQEWLELVVSEVNSLLETYNLSNLPLFKVSTISMDGISDLTETILKSLTLLKDIGDNKPFRMSIDRSFTMKGFGTVVTGTVLNGSIGKGEQTELLPQGRLVTIRGMQSHSYNVEAVKKGDRAAINLQGISKGEITRGDQLVARNTLAPVTEFLGIIHTVCKIPLQVKNNCKISVHSGTAVRTGKVYWYDPNKYLTEQSTLHIKVKLDQPLVVTRGDAFLIRLHSPIETLGGGTIYEVMPSNQTSLKKEWHSCFSTLKSPEIEDIIEYYIKSSGFKPLSLSMLIAKTFESTQHLHKILQNLLQTGNIVEFKSKGQRLFLHAEITEKIMIKISTFLKEYHQTFPDKAGVNLQEISRGTGFTWLGLDIMETLIDTMLKIKSIKREESYYSLSTFTFGIDENFQSVRKDLVNIFLDASFQPPLLDELVLKIGLTKQEITTLCKSLERENILINIRSFYLHRDAWQGLLSFLQNYFKTHDFLPVSDLKNFLKTSRKYTIPIFEYLDVKQYTMRKGDLRIAGKSLF
jgi:selenocysteine-specific elongation factor